MGKKLILSSLTLVLILIAGGLWWNAFFQQSAELQTTDLPLKTARYYWPGMYWIEIADKKGWFQEAGLNVELVDTNSDYFSSLQEMAEGKLVDVHAFSLFDMLAFNARGSDLVLVINADNSFGVEAIVASTSIKTLSDLKGKTIGVSKNTYTEYILTVALNRAYVGMGEVTLIDVPVEKAAQGFIDGNYDAVVTWEPDVTKAIELGNGHSLFDTSEIKGISPNGQVFHRQFVEERQNDVQAYVNVWHKATQFIQNHPQEAYQIIADIYDTTWQEVQAIERLDRIQNLYDNITAFTIASGLESLHGSVRSMNRFMNETNMTEERFDSEILLNDYFIHALHQHLHLSQE